MKRKAVIIMTLVCFMTGLMGCAATKQDTPAQIEEDYLAFREKLETDSSIPETELAKKYAEFFERVENGKKEQAEEYAKLVRKMTDEKLEFSDDEVFEIAKECAELYRDMAQGKDDFGLQEISFSKNSKNETVLIIDYRADVRAYSVHLVGEDEKEEYGEQLLPYDGSLGKYRMKVVFYDADLSEAYLNKHPLFEVQDLGEYKIKGTCYDNHGFCVYIGSDEPFRITEQELTELNHPIGSVDIPIKGNN